MCHLLVWFRFASFKVEHTPRLIWKLIFCLLQMVGETKTGLSSEGFCFPDRHFLPIFQGFFFSVLFLFSFFIFLFFFCKRKDNQVFRRVPVLFFSAPYIKFHIFVAPTYQAIFVAEMSANFFLLGNLK